MSVTEYACSPVSHLVVQGQEIIEHGDCSHPEREILWSHGLSSLIYFRLEALIETYLRVHAVRDGYISPDDFQKRNKVTYRSLPMTQGSSDSWYSITYNGNGGE